MLIPKKSLGQNFLLDKNICKKIINLAEIKNKTVLEIGPGTGQLTDEIIKKKPKKLILIEKDVELYKFLMNKYIKTNNIEILNKDILKTNIKKYKDLIIFSNLPYNISLNIVLKLLFINNSILKIITMLQKEVAEKLDYTSKKRNKYNFLVEVLSNYKIKFNITNKVFYPKPKINSSVTIFNKNKINNIDLNKLKLFTKQIFSHKRKKIRNNIKITTKDKKIINLMNFRAEDLSKNELLLLFNEF